MQNGRHHFNGVVRGPGRDGSVLHCSLVGERAACERRKGALVKFRGQYPLRGIFGPMLILNDPWAEQVRPGPHTFAAA